MSILRVQCILVVAYFSLFSTAIFSVDTLASEYKTANKVVAIGDIHGAYSRVHQLLLELNLINEKSDWVGGNTYLVSLGDLLDRGAESRKVIDLMIKLQQQAPLSGGKVLQVLGNHELMVTTGDLRYVSKQEFKAFEKEETPEHRQALFTAFKRQNSTLDEETLTKQFEEKYPVGYGGFIKEFSTTGTYGKWLKNAAPVIKVNDSLFAHGGLSSDLFEMSLTEINQMTEPVWEYQKLVDKLNNDNVLPENLDFWQRKDYLGEQVNLWNEQVKSGKTKKKLPWYDDYLRFFELEDSFAFSETSPMWYRGNAYCHPYSESFNTERILKNLGAKRIVLGHTPRFKNIHSRLQGQVILADTGMLKEVYNGKASALILENDELSVQYLGDSTRESLKAHINNYSVGSNSMTDAELEDFLRTAEIIETKKIGEGITKSSVITLEKNNQQLRALFKTYDSDPDMEKKARFPRRKTYVPDRYRHEIAAYKLDRMLGLNLIPTATSRKIKNKKGLVQFWIEGIRHEKKREDLNEPFTSQCKQVEQFRNRYIFDVLIYNDDRNQTNIAFTKEDGMLRLIDHTIAFGLSKKRPKMYKKVKFRVSSLFREKLAALTLEALKDELSDWLHKEQIEAIIARRDAILASAVNP